MAALIDAAYLRATFQIHDKIVDGRLTPYIAAASRRIQAWVGATNYADGSLADELKLAEAHLAMHMLIQNVNTNVRPSGLVKREVVEGNVVVEYLSPAETAATAASYFSIAEELTRTFNSASSDPPIAVINDELDAPDFFPGNEDAWPVV